MANMKRISAEELRKATEQMKAKKKVKITGSASSTPQVSNSMSKSQPKTTAGRSPKRPGSPSNSEKKPMPKIVGAKPGEKRLLPKGPNAAPGARRLLANTTTSRTAPKPKVAKRAPLQTKRVGGIFAIPVKPKKTIY